MLLQCRRGILSRGKSLFFDNINYSTENLNSLDSKNCVEAPNEIASAYNWKNAEYWNKVWAEEKYFLPKEDSEEIFKMILPPPNVTGVLHLGHALTCTIQDVLVRWHRMNGKSVMWIPGLDHAGIATQAVVEKYLNRNRGVGRYDLGKENFLSCIQEWNEEKGRDIRNQLKELGASLDWSREFFTMSQKHNEAVNEALWILSEHDLLYRKKDLINWSPSLRSAISEMEIEHVPVKGRTFLSVPGYERKVPFGQIAKVALKLRDSNESLSIATTRVETMPGDVAIAVHPEDPRYARYIGQQVWHPIRETFIPIIQDSSITMEFGTGAMKITPAHSRVDYVIAQRHNLDVIDVIGNDGKLTANAKAFEGIGRYEAREKILEVLTSQGALESMENHEMLIPVCSRSGDVVEQLLREQWFVRTKKMAERAAQAVKDGSLKIDPPELAEVWCNWLGDNRDWCISRQIWWGHRIPSYRCRDSEWIIARNEVEARRLLGFDENSNSIVEQDEDVLDTWFSSALLPLSALGWPDQRYEKFYPLSLMETGHDIIFLWVARMAMLGLELTNRLPFKEVLFHGVLCDAHREKMSKSRGNVIRPEHVINGISLKELNAEAEHSCKIGILSEKELKKTLAVNEKMFPDGITECGNDALRLTLCGQNLKESRISFNVIECVANKHFCNKVWQATRYVLGTTEDNYESMVKPQCLSTVDRWILSRLAFMVSRVNDAFEEKHFYKAILAIKQFLYREFCDFFLEATKPAFRNKQCDVIGGHVYSLTRCLEISLRILAPITPYLAEDLYAECAKKLPKMFATLPSLVEAPYPTFTDDIKALWDPLLEKRFDRILHVIFIVRSVLAQIENKTESQIYVVTGDSDSPDHVTEAANFISTMIRSRDIEVLSNLEYENRENSVMCGMVGTECRVFIVFASSNDFALMRDKIEKKRAKPEKMLANLLSTMKRPGYAKKSEEAKVQDQERIKSLQDKLNQLPKFS